MEILAKGSGRGGNLVHNRSQGVRNIQRPSEMRGFEFRSDSLHDKEILES